MEWKASGTDGEDDFYSFGKDVPYEHPHVNGKKNVLMHVHLPPVLDTERKKQWDQNWERYSRRTSDKALVYAKDGTDRFLLIAILPEPKAHAISNMKTKEDKNLMERFAQIAEAFIYHEKNIN